MFEPFGTLDAITLGTIASFDTSDIQGILSASNKYIIYNIFETFALFAISDIQGTLDTSDILDISYIFYTFGVQSI